MIIFKAQKDTVSHYNVYELYTQSGFKIRESFTDVSATFLNICCLIYQSSGKILTTFYTYLH